MLAMRLTITTWNINSVRLRIDLVAKFIKATRPDVLCLQETKCPDDRFPLKRFKRLGYEHVALNGQKGYHGVAVLSRVPFEARRRCAPSAARPIRRHVTVTLGERAGLRDPITLHNFYVPAGGDEPDPAINPKFAHKLSFLDEMRDCAELRPNGSDRAIIVGDLNVAPLEHDVWSHKQLLRVVSHTPIECEKLTAVLNAGGWVDAMRHFVPVPDQAVHVVELSRARLGRRRQGPPARSHLGLARARRPHVRHHGQEGGARLDAAFRPRSGDGDDRSCEVARASPRRAIASSRAATRLSSGRLVPLVPSCSP